jgi:hypothetical protein
LLFSTQTNLLCSIININEPLHSQDFYRNQFPLSSSTQHHQCIIINTHTSHQQSTGNAQNTGNAYQQQRRKITSGGETEHGFAVFFSQKPNKLFCLVSVKKTQQTRFLGKMGLGLLYVGLQCLVYGKNAGVVVFYGWVAWRRDWEGNGPEGRLQLQKKMVILCCDSDNSLL